ncbi:hypothetical protein BH10BAC2_BH10BAC2_10900 [soil metagenome]
MKRNVSFLAVAGLMAVSFAAKAQCDLKPVITPENTILCPGTKDTLSTTEVFDSYQWFKNSKPIAGATNRFYEIDQYEDAGNFFKVAVTRNGCCDTSKKVLVDGYVFLLPYVVTTGDPGIYNPNKDVTVQCPGDKIIMTMGLPYTENIQWYNLGRAIQGATGQKYTVTEKGSYTVCGSPAVCPSYTDCQSIPVNVTFDKADATITQKGDTLFTSKAKNYQWYFNEKTIPGAKQNYLVPVKSGNYKVGINTSYNCTAISSAYYYTTTLKEIVTVSPNPVNTVMRVHIEKPGVTQLVIADLFGNRYKQIPHTGSDAVLSVGDLHTGTYVLQLLNSNKQVIGSIKIFKQ